MQISISEGPSRTPTQMGWLNASLEQRIAMSEQLGEKGSRAMAKTKGFKPVFDGFGRTLPQGPDQVYRAADGRIIVFEAKGGSGQLGRGYGYSQGSTEWAVESAKRVLDSPRVGAAEKAAAREILQAGAQRRLEVHIVRTRHILGEPTVAVLEGVATTTDDAARLATLALPAEKLAHGVKTAVQPVDDVARSLSRIAASRATSKRLVAVGVAVDVGVRVNDAVKTEEKFATGEISNSERKVTHAKNAAGFAGGWSGAWAGAKGGAALGVVGGPWGSAVGGIVGAVGGYFVGEAVGETTAEWALEE